MSEPRQLYTQASSPTNYIPQAEPHNNYVGPPPPFNNNGEPPVLAAPYNQGSSPPAVSPYLFPLETQQSPIIQQSTYQQYRQGPVIMSYDQSQPTGEVSEKNVPNQTQPMPQVNMNPNVPGGSGVPGNGPQYDANGEREWSNGLFDCFSECGMCCFATFCPCMVYQQVKKRIGSLQSSGRPDPVHGGSGCGGDCLFYGCLIGCCGVGFILQISDRASIRHRYKIRGDGCNDCLASACCTPCALTQSSRELDVEEAKSQ